jgi:DNA invertase Pin-like site-specific DNA recombinase
LVHALKEFHRLGVDFISYQEHIDTTTPQGELIFTVMASLAQFERALISERVKAGMARATAQGKRSSRAPLAQQVQERIAALHVQGISIQQMSKQLHSAYGTAWNYVQRLRTTAKVTQEPLWVIRDGDAHARALSGTSMGRSCVDA